MKTPIYILLSAFFFLSGCASIFGSSADVLIFQSSGPDTYIKVYNSENRIFSEGSSPLIVMLPKGEGYFKRARYKVISENESGETAELNFAPGFSPLYFLNLIGGIIGLFAIDPHTGAMWSFHRKTIVIDWEDITRD